MSKEHPIFFTSDGNISNRSCMLMITHACNLNCTYCYESHKSNENMSFEMARDFIIKEAENVSKNPIYKQLYIDFMGGEPLLNFELIKKVVEWLEDTPLAVPVICFASTNGTLLNNERKEWFRKHKNIIWLGASFDGSTKMQRKNRGTAEYSIDLDFFRETWPLQSLRMTVSKETMPQLAQGLLEMQAKGFLVEVGLAHGVDWTREDAQCYYEQLCILRDAYLADENLVPMNRLLRFPAIKDPETLEQFKTCGSGANMVAYDLDGKTYGCHMFTPLVLGKSAALELAAVNWNACEVVSDSRCNLCILKQWCSTCAGFNYRYRGVLGKRDMRWCSLMLAEALVACDLQIKLLSRKKNLSREEAQYGQAAYSAYFILRDFELSQDESPYLLKR